MKTKLLKQKRIPGLGALVDSLYTSLPVLSIINFLSILTVLYASIKSDLAQWVPWLTFWVFLVLLCALTATMMVLVYKFVLPSVWTFRQKQMFSFESEVLDEIKGLRKEIKNLKGGKDDVQKVQ